MDALAAPHGVTANIDLLKIPIEAPQTKDIRDLNFVVTQRLEADVASMPYESKYAVSIEFNRTQTKDL